MTTNMRNGWRFDGDDDLELTIFPEQHGPDVEVCVAMFIAGERLQDGFGLNETDMRRLAAWLLEMAERAGRFPKIVAASGLEEDSPCT